MGSHGIDQSAWLINAVKRRQHLSRYFFAQLHILLKLREQAAYKYFGLALRRSRFFDQGNFGAQVTIRLAKFFNSATLLTLDQHLDGTVWQFQQLQNSGDSAHAIKCVGSGIIVSRIFLSQQQDLLVARHRSLEGLDRLLASHEQWDHHVRIHNNITQRQERQFDGCLHDFASTAAIRP